MCSVCVLRSFGTRQTQKNGGNRRLDGIYYCCTVGTRVVPVTSAGMTSKKYDVQRQNLVLERREEE